MTVRRAAIATLLLWLGPWAADVAHADASTRKSIKGWVACDGRSDDSAGVAKAFAAAAHGTFTLVVDCPVRFHVGADISKTVFIGDDTSVDFADAGKLIVDNVMHPAFVLAGVKNISLLNWNVEYDASLPVTSDVGGFEQDGRFVASNGSTQPAGAFNDKKMTPWLNSNKSVFFDRTQGNVSSFWPGPTNVCAVFYVIGDTSNLRVDGMRVAVPANAGADRFVPVVFSFQENYKANQSVNGRTPRTAQFLAVPHDLKFSNIIFDGTYMGFVGGLQDATFENVQSHRYADLQDAAGHNVGGVKKWFAPPHLFYFSYKADADPSLFNRNIQIRNVVDDGPRVGTARDKGGSDSVSGYALSLKLGCVNCSVDTYRTTRPDGFMDVLPSDGLTVSNVEASYDSSFLNDVFPGWRFPATGYRHVTFKNVTLTDRSKTTVKEPIGNATQSSNQGIVFSNVRIIMNNWAGRDLPVPAISGEQNDVALDITLVAEGTRLMSVQRGRDAITLRATPFRLPGPGGTQVTWTSKSASSCAASEGWSGGLAVSGSQTVNVNQTGVVALTLTCQMPGETLSTSLGLHVGP